MFIPPSAALLTPLCTAPCPEWSDALHLRESQQQTLLTSN